MPGKKRVRRASDDVPDADDFAKAFYGLKMVFAKYQKRLKVTADTREKYYLETRSPSYNGKPLFFGAVLRGAGIVPGSECGTIPGLQRTTKRCCAAPGKSGELGYNP